MRFLSVAALAACAFASYAGPSPAQTAPPPTASSAAPAAPAPAAPEIGKPRTWIVENHDRLVTVREKDGPPLFAQVIATDNLMAAITPTKDKKSIQITLKDANNKRLYAFPLPLVKHGTFSVSSDGSGSEGIANLAKSSGLAFSITPSSPTADTPQDDEKDDKYSGKGVLEIILGKDNFLVNAVMGDDKDKTVFARDGNKMTMTTFENGKVVDEKSGSVELDAQTESIKAVYAGQKLAAKFGGENKPITLRDEKGEITSKIVTKDGKDYTEFIIGERKIRVAGANMKFNIDDGVFVVKPEVVSPANTGGKLSGKPVAIKDEKGEYTFQFIEKNGNRYVEFIIGERKVLIQTESRAVNLDDGVPTLLPDTEAPAPTKP